jgi:hypothetical protein
MKAVGYNQPLYILPYDHRGSFQTKMFGWTGRSDRAVVLADRAAADQENRSAKTEVA